MNRKIEKECESSCEYILPDYMGDVKKLLIGRARVIPTGKFAGNDTVELSGSVEYDILYADADNKLTSVLTASDYEMSIGIDADSYRDVGEVLTVSAPVIRVTGPRKMSLKATVKGSFTVNEEKKIEVEGDAFADGREPELFTEELEYESSRFGKSGEREYAEEAERLRETDAENIEIVASSGSVRVTEARAVEGGVEIKGEIIMLAIIRTDEQPPFVIRKTIPFTETVSIEGAAEGMTATAEGYITSATCNAGMDNGECVLVVSAIAEYTAEVSERCSMPVVADAYLKEARTENSYGQLEYLYPLHRSERELALSFKLPRSESGCDGIRDILSVCAELRSVELKADTGAAEFTGEAVINGVVCELNEAGGASFVPIKFRAPFSAKTDIGCALPEDAQLDYSLSPTDCTASLDGDYIYVDCKVRARISVLVQRRIKHLSSSTLLPGGEFKKEPSRITVYYPEAGESLFEVAKTFHTSPLKLALDNSLSESVVASDKSSLAGVKKLIIR